MFSLKSDPNLQVHIANDKNLLLHVSITNLGPDSTNKLKRDSIDKILRDLQEKEYFERFFGSSTYFTTPARSAGVLHWTCHNSVEHKLGIKFIGSPPESVIVGEI